MQTWLRNLQFELIASRFSSATNYFNSIKCEKGESFTMKLHKANKEKLDYAWKNSYFIWMYREILWENGEALNCNLFELHAAWNINY